MHLLTFSFIPLKYSTIPPTRFKLFLNFLNGFIFIRPNLISFIFKFKLENAYNLWNFQGKSLQKASFDKLYKFSWRPKPASLLTPEQIKVSTLCFIFSLQEQQQQKYFKLNFLKEIRKNLKQYSEKYNAADRLYQSRVSKELLEKRRKLMDDFTLFRKTSSKRFNEYKQQRLELRRGLDTEVSNDKEEIEYTVQFLVESKKEEIPE